MISALNHFQHILNCQIHPPSPEKTTFKKSSLIRVNTKRPKMVRQTLKFLQHLLQVFKVCLTILGRYTLKSQRQS